ncbi:MAG: sigma-70 family RNA polymerase sigma factor [Armatimonadetes bacterium]|nr:sigma-70 family RNA polymerase sigma factor [Armatimonadota bacterium]
MTGKQGVRVRNRTDPDEQPRSREERDRAVRSVEDGRLLQRWKGGDERAFEELYQKYVKRIYSLSVRLTRSATDAEDVTAETFARAYEAFRRIESGSHVLPWLSRVALNLCRDLGRRRASRKTFSYDDQVDGSENLAVQTPDVSAEPLSQVMDSELREEISDAIQALPDWQRETIILFYLNHKSVDEIADILKVREGTVKSRLARARDALKIALAEYMQVDID